MQDRLSLTTIFSCKMLIIFTVVKICCFLYNYIVNSLNIIRLHQASDLLEQHRTALSAISIPLRERIWLTVRHVFRVFFSCSSPVENVLSAIHTLRSIGWEAAQIEQEMNLLEQSIADTRRAVRILKDLSLMAKGVTEYAAIQRPLVERQREVLQRLKEDREQQFAELTDRLRDAGSFPEFFYFLTQQLSDQLNRVKADLQDVNLQLIELQGTSKYVDKTLITQKEYQLSLLQQQTEQERLLLTQQQQQATLVTNFWQQLQTDRRVLTDAKRALLGYGPIVHQIATRQFGVGHNCRPLDGPDATSIAHLTSLISSPSDLNPSSCSGRALAFLIVEARAVDDEERNLRNYRFPTAPPSSFQLEKLPQPDLYRRQWDHLQRAVTARENLQILIPAFAARHSATSF
jgi:hypothetical protein